MAFWFNIQPYTVINNKFISNQNEHIFLSQWEGSLPFLKGLHLLNFIIDQQVRISKPQRKEINEVCSQATGKQPLFFFLTVSVRAFCQYVNISDCCLLFSVCKVLVHSVWECSVKSVKRTLPFLGNSINPPPQLWDVRIG